MKDLVKYWRLESTGWVSSIRERFDCDKNISDLKRWEWILLIVLSFLKEILNLFIYTISGKAGLTGLCSHIFPLNLELFWILLLKLGIGYILLIYLNLRYHKTNIISRIWVFWGIAIFWPIIAGLKSQQDVINGIAEVLQLAIQCLFFWYFFFIDKVHIDSFKLLVYDNLIVDESNGRIYRSPSSKISTKKLTNLAIYVACLIGLSLILIILVMQLIDAVSKSAASSGGTGGGGKPSKPTTPENQKSIENAMKNSPISVAIGSIIIAPITEEWVYRRFIMKEGGFKWWTIPISGFVFGLIHLRSGEGFSTLVPYVIPGLVFATGMYISRNIWHSTIAHALYNTMTLIKMLLILK